MSPDDDPRATVLALFREHGTAVLRFALVLVRRRDEAEDVVQETYLKLLRHIEAGGDTTNLRGWLFTVAAHDCRDRIRHRSRWRPWAAEHETVVDPAPLPDEDGRLHAARVALGRLGVRDRLLITLRARGLSYRDIAHAAGLKPASVGRLLARALDRWERACPAEAALPQAYRRSPS
jgi:RNA polymerase sigma-70 factor (ECF subfamily)